MFFAEMRVWISKDDIVYEKGAWLPLYGVLLHV